MSQLTTIHLGYADLYYGLSRRYNIRQLTPADDKGVSTWQLDFGEVSAEKKVVKIEATRDYIELIVAKTKARGYTEKKRVYLGKVNKETSEKHDLDPRVREFMRMVVGKANKSAASSLQVDIEDLDLDQIEQAKMLVQLIDKAKKDNDDDSAVMYITNYRVIIPVVTARVPMTVDAYISQFNVAAEYDRLQQIETIIKTKASLDASDSIGVQYSALGCKITPIEINDPVFEKENERIRRLSMTHEIEEMFEIEIPSERAEWNEDRAERDLEVMRLYHGTREANYQHILSQGLIITPVATNGSRLGRGIYFADNPNKSKNYSGGSSYMFIADVATGNKKVESGSNNGLSPDDPVYHSMHGINSFGGMDEFVVYNKCQQTIRYVVKICPRKDTIQ